MINLLAQWLEPGALFLIDVTLKTTLFMAIVLFVSWTLSSQQSAKRSLLFSLCLFGLLVIPIASAFMPALRPPFAQNLASYQAPFLNDQSVLTNAPLTNSPKTINQQKNQAATAIDEHLFDAADLVPVGSNTSTLTQQPIHWRAWGICLALAIYAVGVLVQLFRLAHSLVLVRSLRRTFLQSKDQNLLSLLDVLKEKLNIQRSVDLAISERIGSPTQIGVFNPAIVLPVHLNKASEMSESILVHELVHIKRWDCFYRLLALALGTIYWFNPLIYRICQGLSDAQEQVCDDWTVDAIGNNKVYADALLNVATRMKPRLSMAVGMDMARTSQVLGRVNRIITLGGRVVPKVGTAFALVMVFVFVGGAMALGSVTASNDQIPDDANVIESTPAPEPDQAYQTYIDAPTLKGSKLVSLKHQKKILLENQDLVGAFHIAADDSSLIVVPGNHSIREYALDGSFRRTLGKHGYEVGEYKQPRFLAKDESGKFYILDATRILQYKPNGEYVQFMNGRFNSTNKMVLDRAGDFLMVTHRPSGIKLMKYRSEDFTPLFDTEVVSRELAGGSIGYGYFLGLSYCKRLDRAYVLLPWDYRIHEFDAQNGRLLRVFGQRPVGDRQLELESKQGFSAAFPPNEQSRVTRKPFLYGMEVLNDQYLVALYSTNKKREYAHIDVSAYIYDIESGDLVGYHGEDSEFSFRTLDRFGSDGRHLYVYTGGFWDKTESKPTWQSQERIDVYAIENMAFGK